MKSEERDDEFTAIEKQFAGYEVYDSTGEKLGKVDALFVNEYDRPEYVGVRTGLLGTRITLLPWEIVEVHETDRRLIVSATKDHIKDGPAFDDDQEVTPELEGQVRSYYGLQSARATATEERATYGAAREIHHGAGRSAGSASRTPTHGGADRTGWDEGLSEEDEVRVPRVEEELLAGTREREAGAVRVRKRVATEHQRMEVPTHREEVHVERVPVEGEVTAETEIGEDEVVIPVVEEEVVVEKRPVVKEEVRIRKEVIEDTEVVEEDVRREEVEVDDETTRHGQ